MSISSSDGLVSAVEDRIADAVRGLGSGLREASQRVASAGGRRFRARLVLLAADAADPGPCAAGVEAAPSGADRAGRRVAAAAAVELVHLASLVHDDLLDDARTRRGVPTINAVEGPAAALLAGNCLQAAAMGCAAALGAEAVELMQQAVVDLCAGAMLEQQNRFRADVREDDVLQVAELKAASLLAAAARLGALAAGDGVAAQQPLGEYGRLMGLSLQLLDDLLDVTSTAELFGKPVGTDFPGGIVTLPALAPLGREARLRELLRPGLSEAERSYAIELIRAGGGLVTTVRAAEEYASAAAAVGRSADLPGRAAARSLAALPEHMVKAQLRLADPHLAPLLAPSAATGERPRPA